MSAAGCILRNVRGPGEARGEGAGRHGGDLRQKSSVSGLNVGVDDVDEERPASRLPGRRPRLQLSGKMVIFQRYLCIYEKEFLYKSCTAAIYTIGKTSCRDILRKSGANLDCIADKVHSSHFMTSCAHSGRQGE